MCLFNLKILPYGELELLHEDLLESIEVVLFVEDEHGFLVVDGVDRAEAQRAVAVGYQDGII